MTCDRREKAEGKYCIHMYNKNGESYSKSDGIAYCAMGFICDVWTQFMANDENQTNVTCQTELNDMICSFNSGVIAWGEKNMIVLHRDLKESIVAVQQCIDEKKDLSEFRLAIEKVKRLYRKLRFSRNERGF